MPGCFRDDFLASIATLSKLPSCHEPPVTCKPWQVALPLASPFTGKREYLHGYSRFVPWLAPGQGISRRLRTAPLV